MTPTEEPAIEVMIPRPHREPDERRVDSAIARARQEHVLVAVTDYPSTPCAPCWVEIVLTLLAVKTAEHYIDRLLDVLDAAVGERFSSFTLSLKLRGQIEPLRQKEVPRGDRQLAHKLLSHAFFEMAAALKAPDLLVR